MSKEMTIYDYMKDWFDYCFENPEVINPNHSALYFFILSHANRLGWKNKFGLPTTMTKEAIGIKSYTTYIKTLNDVVSFGFIKMLERSKNQYSSNIIALTKNDKALVKALDKATVKHVLKQEESTCESNSSIDILSTNKLNTNLKVDWDALLGQFNEITGKKAITVNQKVKTSIMTRLKEGYSKQNILDAIINCYNDAYHKETGHKYLTLEFISRPDKLEKYSTMNPVKLKEKSREGML